jgi:Fe2+ or Zn2+ uptake regulation protein
MKSAKNILRQYLKNNGLLQSKQREQILDIFLETEEHPIIGDLYELVRKKTPKSGLANSFIPSTLLVGQGCIRASAMTLSRSLQNLPCSRYPSYLTMPSSFPFGSYWTVA